MGRPPYSGSSAQHVLGRVVAGPPTPLNTSLRAPAPPELVRVCETAMARVADQRFDSADLLADAVDQWLDDTFKREQALRLTEQALMDVHRVQGLQEQAADKEADGNALLATVKSWQPEDDKVAGWALIDAARATAARAKAADIDIDQRLFAALRMAPDLPQAHAALLHRSHQRHRQAEQDGDLADAAIHEGAMRRHLQALPTQDPRRIASEAYLRGDGTLSLTTSPPGASVRLYRYTKHHRRLVETFERDLGTTPIVGEALPMGSYLCVLSHPDHDDVRYPVHIQRQEDWSTTAPGDVTPAQVMSPDDVYIPAGWFASGGDPDTFGSHPARRLWCDGLVIQRFQVTNHEFIAFLDDLVAQGRADEAMTHVPRERSSSEETLGAVLYGRTADGGFCLQVDADGDIWEPDWPVFHLDWHSARAYLTWLAEKTGKPWRLPGELEWEKAARGVDGRLFPWGDAFDPSWCCMHDSHQGRQLATTVDSYPTDASVYGVRGVAGGVRDWCADYEGVVDEQRVCVPKDEDAVTGNRRVRGGSWYGPARNCRLANRDRNLTGYRVPLNGFRGVYRPDER